MFEKFPLKKGVAPSSLLSQAGELAFQTSSKMKEVDFVFFLVSNVSRSHFDGLFYYCKIFLSTLVEVCQVEINTHHC
jgi:hypothetical protein